MPVPQLVRQWGILRFLENSRYGCTVARLAEEFGCSVRTIYRDLQVLQEAGFPLYRDLVDGQAIWRFVDGYKFRLRLTVKPTELLALYLARNALSIFKGTFFYKSLEDLLKKAEENLIEESKSSVYALAGRFVSRAAPQKDYSRHEGTIQGITTAITLSRRLEMEYLNVRGELSNRKVDPYNLYIHKGTVYLIGFCHKRGEVRIFAVDRIKRIKMTEEEFSIPGEFNVDEYMGDSFGVMHGEKVKVKVRFDPETAIYVKEKRWHRSQKTRELEDGSVEAVFEVAGTGEIGSWILSFGSHAEVLDPPDLREKIREELGRSLEIYSKPPAKYPQKQLRLF